MRKYGRGEHSRLPYRIQLQLVAARYGQSPEAVAEWPADLFLDAVQCLGITGGTIR